MALKFVPLAVTIRLHKFVGILFCANDCFYKNRGVSWDQEETFPRLHLSVSTLCKIFNIFVGKKSHQRNIKLIVFKPFPFPTIWKQPFLYEMNTDRSK